MDTILAMETLIALGDRQAMLRKEYVKCDNDTIRDTIGWQLDRVENAMRYLQTQVCEKWV